MYKLKLKELRKMNHMTQEALAEATNISQQTISRYENGIHYPDIDTLITFADLFNVPLDILVGRIWPKDPSAAILGELLEKEKDYTAKEKQEISSISKRMLSSYRTQEELSSGYLDLKVLSEQGRTQMREIYKAITIADSITNKNESR